jgi:hypothetical protein
MSQVKVSGNASGTGIFTIAAPNSSTNRTLTLPDNTGTFLTSATTTGFPAGSVLQVVSTNSNTQATYTDNQYITPLQTTITPTSSTSKILVQVFLGFIGADSAADLGIIVYRDATTLAVGTGGVASSFMPGMNVASGNGNAASWSYLDSPASTSLLTYKLQAKPNSVRTMYFNRRGADASYSCSSTVVLTEIAA